jgi:hypothetical protein
MQRRLWLQILLSFPADNGSTARPGERLEAGEAQALLAVVGIPCAQSRAGRCDTRSAHVLLLQNVRYLVLGVQKRDRHLRNSNASFFTKLIGSFWRCRDQQGYSL